jgi:protein SCO1/2
VRIPFRLLAGAALAAAVLAACGGGGSQLGTATPAGSSRVVAPKGLRGIVQSPGAPKPNFTLTDTSGQAFNLPAETNGHVTLLYFGYTHCPDICPTHMANIAAALHQLPPPVTSQVKVVFVTTDPARDTEPVLRGWLDHFDPSFIGLTGTVDQIEAAEAASGLPPSTTENLGKGNYAVDHAAFVEAFTSDNLDHVVYPAGYQEKDWVNDLPKLVQGWPGS